MNLNIGLVHARPEMRALLRETLAPIATYELLWEVGSSSEALERNALQPARLVLLELVPGEDTVGTTRALAGGGSAVLLLRRGGNDTHAATVFDALGNGAVDVVELPITPAPALVAPLLLKLKHLADLLAQQRTPPGSAGAQPTLVAIGASAGGPAAIAQILGGLPLSFPAAILIVQHIDAQFASGMSDWLGQDSTVPVRLALEGGLPEPGVALLANGHEHLLLSARQHLCYSTEPSELTHRPSIDVLFESIARRWRGRAIGVLLTGMGEDGARGLRVLRDRGHHTIAQDAASSAIYGMPRAAARLKAATEILPVTAIAGRLDILTRAGDGQCPR